MPRTKIIASPVIPANTLEDAAQFVMFDASGMTKKQSRAMAAVLFAEARKRKMAARVTFDAGFLHAMGIAPW